MLHHLVWLNASKDCYSNSIHSYACQTVKSNAHLSEFQQESVAQKEGIRSLAIYIWTQLNFGVELWVKLPPKVVFTT